MTKTVIGLFDDRNEGEKAYAALRSEGYAQGDLDILTNDDKDDVPKLANLRNNIPSPDSEVYLEGVRKGGTIITASVADSSVGRATEILSNFNIVNIAKRAEEFRKVDSKYELKDSAKHDDVIDVIEEELQVGKEQVERGRLRIYNVVTEREVSQNVSLRDETIRVNRRPINREVTITPDLFKARSFEMVEIDEIAKVSKTARVVEEVYLGKEVVDKIETIKETLRRQDVEIEEIATSRTFQDYDGDFRSFYGAHLTNSGVTYDALKPAFNFGYSLATREPFRSSPWSAVEADSRRIWEDKNPGTWDQNAAVIKYAWEKVRSAK